MTTATESPATEEHVTAEATPRSGDNLSLKSGIEEEDGELGDLKEEDEPASGREGGEISDDVAALQDELNKITVAAPTVNIKEHSNALYKQRGVSEYFDSSEFPQSFKENNPKEKLILAYAENFRRQYVHLYRDRKPLFLNPNNECGLEKLVCTTIRPTQLPYKELYDWDGAAEFVADYLNFTMLEPAHELPVRLLSPTTIMKRQKGNCFEYSTLLVSLLVAA
uniref:Uncharacterized protein n=2 Tax=Capitella teleta TaxID=283909 RepID=X2A9M0_CAPTE